MLKPATDLAGNVKVFIVGAPENASAPTVITAAGTGDNTAVTGQTIDTYASGQRGESGVLIIGAHCKLTATKVLTVAAELQESADGSAWDTAEALYAATTVVSGTGQQFDEKETHVKLKGRKRYIRFNFTPNLTAGATDTADIVALFVMGGCRRTPVS
jgi:hypothetical protein